MVLTIPVLAYEILEFSTVLYCIDNCVDCPKQKTNKQTNKQKNYGCDYWCIIRTINKYYLVRTPRTLSQISVSTKKLNEVSLFGRLYGSLSMLCILRGKCILQLNWKGLEWYTSGSLVSTFSVTILKPLKRSCLNIIFLSLLSLTNFPSRKGLSFLSQSTFDIAIV